MSEEIKKFYKILGQDIVQEEDIYGIISKQSMKD